MTPSQFTSAVLHLVRQGRRFPDSRRANIPGRVRAFERRRAKNRRARASRKANR